MVTNDRRCTDGRKKYNHGQSRGGTAGKNSVNYKISLPADMVKALGVTQDDKSVSVDYVDGKIIIEKISHDKGRQ